jgi:hypothetical protein
MKSAPAWVGLRKSPFRRIRNSIQSNWVNTIRQYLFLEIGDFAASIAGETENPLAIMLVSSAFFISVSVSI